MVGTVTISIEVELAWGFHDLDTGSEYLSRGRKIETKILSQLLEHCNRHDIPISFDIVGYLLHDRYHSIEDSPHDSDWLPVEPDSSSSSHPLFYAPDIAREIQDSKTPHEICSHTYTHVPLGNYPHAVDWDLEKAVETHRDFGLPEPTSLVPPRHSMPDLSDILQQFEILRLPRYSLPTSRIHRFKHLLTRTHPCCPPEKNGFTTTYSTPSPSLTAMYLKNGQNPPHPAFRVVPESVRKKIHSRYLYDSLERVVETGSHIHHWTHLFNLSNDVQWPIAREFLTKIADFRDEDKVEIKRMNELADPGRSNHLAETERSNRHPLADDQR